MESAKNHLIFTYVFIKLFCNVILPSYGSPVYSSFFLKTIHSEDLDNKDHMQSSSNTSDCNPVEYLKRDVIFFENKNIFLKSNKLIIHSDDYQIKNNKILICSELVNVSSEGSKLNCGLKFVYESDEYKILESGSALVKGQIIPSENYTLNKDDELLICVTYFDDNNISYGSSLSEISIYIGNTGSGISIIALIFYLVTFCYLPTLRNLPGYNLASLSTAFLLAYSFLLIGQIRSVVGMFCVISAAFQQTFFLAAFFCMNVLAIDVWRTLKLATERLIIGSQNTRKRQFLWYSIYAWGCPTLITTISVIIDNVDGVPDLIKPYYGKSERCWVNNSIAKTIFFVVPAFTLFLINGLLFLRSSWMISSNSMKCPNDNNKQAVKLNYILYVRLGIMMGVSWLLGVIALIVKNEILWLVFDIFNSLQGLFLFLLFTCTRKVMKNFIQKVNSTKNSTDKHTTISTNSINFNSKN